MTDASASALDIDTDTAVIRQLRLSGVDLLCDDDPLAATREEPELWHGAFVMAPWVSHDPDRKTGPVADGSIAIPPAGDRARAAISPWHGFVRHGRWSSDPLGLRYDGPPDIRRPDGWSLVLSWVLRRERLNLCLTAGTGDAPGTLTAGWHPWFRRQIRGCVGTLDAGTGARARDPEPDSIWGPVPSGSLDHYIHSPDGVTISWPGVGELGVYSSSAEYLVFDSEPHGICVEPVMTPAGRAIRIPGGQTQTLEIHLRFTPARHADAVGALAAGRQR